MLSAALLGARVGLSPEARHPSLLARELTSLDLVCDGPHFPVRDAVNRPRPAGPGSPLVALDLTGGDDPPGRLAGMADLLVRATGSSGTWSLMRP